MDLLKPPSRAFSLFPRSRLGWAKWHSRCAKRGRREAGKTCQTTANPPFPLRHCLCRAYPVATIEKA